MRPYIVLALLTLGCGRSDEERVELTLRVGTPWGLASPSGASSSTATVHLQELFTTRASERFEVVAVDGTTIRLRALEGNSPAGQASFAHPRLRKTTTDGATTVLVFEPPVPPLREILIDRGPFAVVAFEQDVRLVLRRRTPDPPSVDVLDLRNFSSEEELWRHFLVDEVDVVPLRTATHRKQLEHVPSVRSVSLAEPSTIALRLNMTSPQLADPQLRLALALAIRREPIAEAATGSTRNAVERPEDPDAALQRLRTSGLRVVVLYDRAQTTVAQALLVLERQWSSVGVRCEFVGADLPEFIERLKSRDFDAVVFFGGFEQRYHYMFRSGGEGNFTGYANPAFDTAVDSGDFTSAGEILDADTAVIPLYRVRETYAYHSRFCNVHPKVTYDLSWLADMRLCRPGERD